MKLRIEEINWFERPVKMRLPFQFGNTEVHETAEAFVRVLVSVEGKSVVGKSAQLMVPRWFDKRQTLSNPETIEELRDTVRATCSVAVGLSGTVAELSEILRTKVQTALPEDTPLLATGFGPALVEMALIDAASLAASLPFWRAAQTDLFGLAGTCPSDLTPESLQTHLGTISAPTTLKLRHTIGFDAPLHGTGDLNDGLPVTVSEVIAATGINAFKIKLKGNPEADHRRLTDIAGLIDTLPAYSATLDANEQYSRDAFRDFLGRYQADPTLERFRAQVRFFEQPFARETALQEQADFGVPLLIDESDDHEDAFPKALAHGWAGTSVKSCKGVLRALINMARAKEAGAVLSGEDLTCQPGLCWQQDSAMASAVGAMDVERNGHHFAGGMQGADDAEVQRFLTHHDDIYTNGSARPSLRIADGKVDIRSLDEVGFANKFKDLSENSLND